VNLQQVACPRPPDRPADGHKGTFGRVLLIGGSVGMSGSIALSARAALRAGSGLVTVAVPQSIQAIVAAMEACYMTVGLPSATDGSVDSCSLDRVRELATGFDAIGIGPGLGQSAGAASLLRSVVAEADCPLVLDADALNLIARHQMLCDGQPGKHTRVMTPHPGEFARLSGLSMSDIAADREQVAARFADESQSIVVLKGAGTIVTDGQQIFVGRTGNSGMGTGGSGDVLTGIITSLIGQGMNAFSAAALGVHVHGLSGDIAAEAISQRALTANDLVETLGAAWLSLADEAI